MAFTRPVTKTLISSVDFGQPVYDWITGYGTPTPWTAPTLLSGWVNEGGGIQPCQYRRVGDVVQIRGTVKSGTNPNIMQLPAGFRPPALLRYGAYSMNPSTGAIGTARLDIQTGGLIAVLNMADMSHTLILAVDFSTT